jgi:hypothetical protein
MGAARKFDLDHRLEAYFATLRSAALREALKRSAGNWQLYAAVTGSALAMVTNASAQIIGSGIPDIWLTYLGAFAATRIARRWGGGVGGCREVLIWKGRWGGDGCDWRWCFDGRGGDLSAFPLAL